MLATALIQSAKKQKAGQLVESVPSFSSSDTCRNPKAQIVLDVYLGHSHTIKMRSSAVTMSHMPSGKRYTGWWGSAGGPMQKGITQYTLSHFRQNPLQGAFSHTLFQGFNRIIVQVPYFLVPFAVAYGTISWAVKKNEWYNSKAGHLATAEHDE